MYTIYGIKNCDTMKKAFAHLAQQGIDYTFVDYARRKPSREDLQRWREGFGDWPVNKAGPTFRKIKEAYEAADDQGKIDLLIANSSAIKRPILEGEGLLLKGFVANEWPQS